jgi:iron complex outermembrane recepter protein
MPKVSNRLGTFAGLCLATLLGFSDGKALAQQSPVANDTVLDEVVVSVQRRQQNLEDVGTSVTAFDTADLQSFASKDLTGLTERVPGLQYNQYSPTVTIFNIRGVSQNDYADHLEAPIAVYVDDVYLSAAGALDSQMFDLAGAEVARGPQGTLFGRNATGGLIHLTTAKPTDTPDGYFEVTGGSYDQFNTEGAFGGPLADGLRGRVSFATNYNDGYMTNRIGPDLGNSNNYSLRAQLEADVGSNATFLVNVHGSRDLDEHEGLYSWTAAYPCKYDLGCYEPPNLNYWGTCPGCDIDGYKNPSSNPFNQAFNSPTYFYRTVGGATGTLTWTLPFATLVSVTDYTFMEKDYAEDSDASPNSVYAYHTTQSFHQYSEELRLSGTNAALDWTAGLYFLDIESHDIVISDAFPTIAVTPYGNKTVSWAAFGQTEYRFSPEFSAIAGLRYSSDTKQEDYSLFVDGVETSVFNTTIDPTLAKRVFDAVSAKFELDYKPAKNTLLYASYNRGTKGGGFEAPNFPPVVIDKLPYQGEVLTDYETGFKLTLLGGIARLNADVFYYDYHNYQAFSFVDLTDLITNHNAIDKGGEVELAAKPVEGLTVQAGLSMLTTEVKDVSLPDGITTTSRYLPQAPANSLTYLVKYQHALAGGVASIQTDWKHDASQYFTVLNNPDEREAARTYGNVRAGYDFPGRHWQAAFFINNVTNKYYSIYREDFSAIGSTQDVLARPRWYGVTVSYRLK